MQLRLDTQEGRGADTAQNIMKLYKNMETHTSRGLIVILVIVRFPGQSAKNSKAKLTW